MMLNNGCTPDDMAGSLTSSAHDGSPVHDSSLFQAGLRKLGDALPATRPSNSSTSAPTASAIGGP